MKGQIILVIGIFAVTFSTVSDALAIGFEVDTPLDPFLGGLSKIKRSVLRRLKNFSIGDPFPGDELFGQQSIMLPTFFLPEQMSQLTSQYPVTSQIPLASYERRKLRFGQNPAPSSQQLEIQLSALNPLQQNQQLAKRGTTYQNFHGLGQQQSCLQQYTQPLQYTSQFSTTQQQPSFV